MAKRQSVAESTEAHHEDAKKIRSATGRMKTLDAEPYMTKHPGNTFFWKEQNNGDVDRWLGLGAELVPEAQASVKKIEGYESRKGNTWVCRNVDMDALGKDVRTDYLMMMSEAEYYMLKTGPEEERNREMQSNLHRAYAHGELDGDARGDSTLDTYAPNLPTGGVGFEQVRGEMPDGG